MLTKTVIVEHFHHFYKNEDASFSADIRMNPRDAMVFAHITALPDTEEERREALLQFTKLLESDYQGKCAIRVAPHLIALLPPELLEPGKHDVIYLSMENVAKVTEEMKDKPRVSSRLQECAKGEFLFLDKADLFTRTKALAELKIIHSSFVDTIKITNGLYSEKAENEKLNNPFVEHYAIEHQGRLIASLMNVIHGDLVYSSDFIIHSDYRKKGWVQALIVQSFQHLSERHPEVTGVWVIPGAYGTLGVGRHLCHSIFPAISLKEHPEMQKELGLIIRFGAPGCELLKASNRDFSTQKSLDEDKYIEDALKCLALSHEFPRAAPPPPVLPTRLSPLPEMPSVLPFSVFLPEPFERETDTIKKAGFKRSSNL